LFLGFDDGTFGPQRSITRGQFASALARLVRATGTSLPAGGRGFDDVSPGSTHADAIRSLAAAGVIGGFEDGTFRPRASITREQAASLMVRAHRVVVGSALPAGPDAFGDDDGSVHEANINAAAAVGWIQGRGPRVFEPRSDISRAQMASVTARVANTWVVDGFLVLPRL
jgi:hypothetical protein